MLEKIADFFETDVSELLGKEISTEAETTDMGELVKQLTILNEYLAENVRRRKNLIRITKKLLFSLLIAVLIGVSVICAIEAFDTVASSITANDEINLKLQCSLDGEEYTYDISYSDNHFMMGGYGEPEAVKNIFSENGKSEQDNEARAQEIMQKVKEYFIKNGGNCEIVYQD